MNYKKISLYVLTAALLGVSPTAMAQGGDGSLQKANKHYTNSEYALALQEYLTAVGISEPNLKTAQRIADSYRQLQRTQEAETWYAKVVAMPDREPVNLFYYAEMLRSNGKYEEAKAQYAKWATEQPDMADRAKQFSDAADFAMKAKSGKPVATVERLAQLNADKYSDFSPAAFEGGIIFTSDRPAGTQAGVYGLTGRPYLQLYTAQKNGNNWETPVMVQDLAGTELHTASASAGTDGQVIYFTRSRNLTSNATVNSDPTSWTKPVKGQGGTNNLEIFSAERTGSRWANIKPFAYNKVDDYSVGHPALTADGKIMYFVSDMPGGQGSTDIYYTMLQADGMWSEPVNAGTTINTIGRETYPSVDEKDNLYFASNGHAGLGGLDIFKAEGKHATWTTVTNLGQPINSSKNDFGILFSETDKKGMLSSNRSSDNGTDDLFSFSMLSDSVVVAINATGPDGKAIEGVQIELRRKGETEATAIATDEQGRFYVGGVLGDEFTVRGSKEGFLNQSLKVAIPESASDTLNMAMRFESSEEDKPIVLQNVYYDYAKWNIRKDAAVELDKLVEVLKENPDIRIEIGAHTDSRQTKRNNLKLSNRRAKSVVDYLVSRGIDRSRLESKGYGESRLLNRCADGVKCTPAEHQLNRRTEFKIIK